MASTQVPTKDNETYNKRGFWALIATQFQGAFNDNLYKLIIILYLPVLVGDTFPVTGISNLLFTVPWLVFPALAGALSDHYSKKHITVLTKVWEVGVMATGVIAVMVGSVWLLFFTLFLMSMQSAFFSPAKYGILPEILPEPRLSWGNGQMSLFTFVSIILGTAAAGFLVDGFEGRMHIAMLIPVGLSLAGLCTSLMVTKVPAAEPTRRIPINPYSGMGRYFSIFWNDTRLFSTMVGIAFFWFSGTLVIQTIIELGKALSEAKMVTSSLLALMSLGIGVGSVTSGIVSRKKIETGLVPLSAVGMTFFLLLLAIPTKSYPLLLTLLFLLGFSSGFFSIPFSALLQQRSPSEIRSAMIATGNFVNFAGMSIASVLFILLFNVLGCSPNVIFLIMAVFVAVVNLYLFRLEPSMLLRCALWCYASTRIKLHVKNRLALPEKGGALLVGDHTSLLEALVLTASTDRKLHFLMTDDVYEKAWSKKIAKLLPVIAVPREASDQDLSDAVEAMRSRIAEGHVVCIPAERRFHKEGDVVPWYEDYGLLVKDLDAPVLPVHVDRMWNVFHDIEDGDIIWRMKGKWRHPVYVQYGEAMGEATDGEAVQDAVHYITYDSYMQRDLRYGNIFRTFVPTARRYKKRMAMADASSGELSYFKALVGSVIFARKLKPLLDEQEMVGVLLPPTIGGSLTNIALQMMGKIPVNLNYSTSDEVMESYFRQCNLTQVITAKAFIKRIDIKIPGEHIYLEDVKRSVSGKDRITSLLIALLYPATWMEKMVDATPRSADDVASIIFSSGSEGEPKGVMLTQRNVLSQTSIIAQWIPHHAKSCIVGFLPFFHSFGHIGPLWLALHEGITTFYHPNPLEPRVIGELTEKYEGTIMVGTATFFQGFLRRCSAEQFKTLEIAVAGAEKLPERIRNAFDEKFGIAPLEGYGTTECTPVVSVNIPDLTSPGFFWQGLRHGSVGRPIPGEMLRVLDPDSGAELPIGKPGLLEVKGPNIMQGYLNMPEKTAAALRDGWYNTGDIALLDEDGFIHITDRLARFSKIGAEMVPHTKVEEVLHDMLGLTELTMAVTGTPHEQRGEQLVVVHTLTDEQLSTLMEKLKTTTLPNLWIPKNNAFFRVDEIPILATGKTDMRAVKKIALELTGH